MKLTKYIPVAVFSLLFMASCNSNDEQSGKVITNKAISYSTGGNTRLADNKFEEGDAFSVWANYRVDGETDRYITNQQVTLTDNKWTPDRNYFWPMGGVLDFYAVYPSPESCSKNSANEIIVDGDKTVPMVRYQINSFSDDVDVVVAKSPAVNCPSEGLVPLHFKHVLGRMRLQVTNECEYGIPLDVHVTSMTIKAMAYNKGFIDWETLTMKVDETAIFSLFKHDKSSFDIAAGGTENVGTYYVIPGIVKDFTVTVNWQILNAGVVAARYEVTKRFSSEYQLNSGVVKNFNFILKRAKAGDISDGDVDIVEGK